MCPYLSGHSMTIQYRDLPPSKTCTKCLTPKPLQDFHKNTKTRDGRSSWCKQCANGPRPEYRAARYGHEVRRQYGIDLADYEQMLAMQSGVCAICHLPNSRPIRLAVDHDHHTGAVRALLCDPCNRAIGLMKDSPDRLPAAAAYLDLHVSAHT